MPISFITIDVAGATNTDAHGINASGQIVGDYTDGSGTQGFLLSGGTLTTLNDPTSLSHSTFATSINGSGQIVGYDRVGAWQGFLDDGGTYTNINAPGGGWTFLEGINDSGQIVGYTYPGSTPLTLPYVTSFVYSGGSFTSIRDPQEVPPTQRPINPRGTFAQGINNAGQVVGYYSGTLGAIHGFLYSAGTYTTLDDPLGAGG